MTLRYNPLTKYYHSEIYSMYVCMTYYAFKFIKEAINTLFRKNELCSSEPPDRG